MLGKIWSTLQTRREEQKRKKKPFASHGFKLNIIDKLTIFSKCHAQQTISPRWRLWWAALSRGLSEDVRHVSRTPASHLLSCHLGILRTGLAESNWKIWACFSLQSITVLSTVKSTQMLLSLAPARAQTQGLPMAVATSSLPCRQQVTSRSTRAVFSDHHPLQNVFTEGSQHKSTWC